MGLLFYVRLLFVICIAFRLLRISLACVVYVWWIVVICIYAMFVVSCLGCLAVVLDFGAGLVCCIDFLCGLLLGDVC